MKFRTLNSSEIDCRVATVKEKGFSLLLYKDARCDMNILDETVGPTGWQRKHLRDNKNCIVSIWDKEKGQWIEKEDTGTESNSEAQKGLASDSFKRACFNWGIGRELYTSPFIWINANQGEVKSKGDKFTTYEKFTVSHIECKNGIITELKIIDKNNTIRFTYLVKGTKTEMRLNTMAFTKAQEAIKTGSYTIDDVEKKYILSDEIKTELLK